MPTASEVEDAAADVNALTVILAAEFASEVTNLAGVPPTEAAGLLRDLAAELADEFGHAASLVMAEWYETVRPEPGFDATLVEPDTEALQRNLSWSVRDLFAEEPDIEAAASKSAGVTDLAVTDTARQTVIQNARRDPLDVRYARHASANACAFCAMLATRQATYRAEDSAGFKSHRNCHCIAVPVWPGETLEEPPYVASWRETYHQARKESDGSTTAILAAMRRIGDLR